MSESPTTTNESPSRGRARGRSKSRGGLGKYLRARGRRGYGRPAEFQRRLLLEGEAPTAEEGEEQEEAAERALRFSKRQLGTNVDRYAEPEPELGSDGEPIIEPEIDISHFLEKEKQSDTHGSSLYQTDGINEDDVDRSISHITSSVQQLGVAPSMKGRTQTIEWDSELDAMSREKATAEANWDLKARFKAKSDRLRTKPIPTSLRERKADISRSEAPSLPISNDASTNIRTSKVEMEDFLDDLLSR